MIIWFLFGAMCMLVVLFLAAYWRFMHLNSAAKKAWQQLDNNLKNRAELIPTLALSAASFEELERGFIDELYNMREICRQPAPIAQRAAHEEQVTKAFKKVFTAAQNHPELTMHSAFARLRDNVIKAEGKVQRSKRKYNNAAHSFNTMASIIPLNLIAILFEFSPYEYFDFGPSLSKSDNQTISPKLEK